MSEKTMKEMYGDSKAAKGLQRGAEANNAAEKTPEETTSSAEDVEQSREDFLLEKDATKSRPSDEEIALYATGESSEGKAEKGQGWLNKMKENLAKLDEEGAKPTLKPDEDLPDHLK